MTEPWVSPIPDGVEKSNVSEWAMLTEAPGITPAYITDMDGQEPDKVILVDLKYVMGDEDENDPSNIKTLKIMLPYEPCGSLGRMLQKAHEFLDQIADQPKETP